MFLIGAMAAFIGCLIIASAIIYKVFYLFIIGSVLLGFSQANQQFYRYAAADNIETKLKSKAISLVLAGGLIKGTLGFGMPMVALPIIAFTIPATTAMILLCAPIFLTNFLQIKFKEGISSYRFLPMFLFLVFVVLLWWVFPLY